MFPTKRLTLECACRLIATLVACVTTAAWALAGVVPFAHAEIRGSDRVAGRSYKELGIVKGVLPDVALASGVLVTEDGRVLWSRRPEDRRAIASITKIMTAVVALEHGDPDDPVTIPRSSAAIGESTAFLRPGERLPLSELVEALLIKSGNDAAVAIAEHVTGSEEGFVKLMNAKAEELGLSRTRFRNSHGLDQANHYSTAADISTLVRYAMTKPEIRRAVARKTATIGEGRRTERIENTNLMLGNYPGMNGVKTGWTNRAGYSLVGSAERGGLELQAVVLGTGSEIARFRDARELLDFGFAHYRWQRLASKGTVIGEAPVADYLDMRVPAAVSADTSVAVFDLAGPITRTVSVAQVEAPVRAGDRVGVATFTQAGETIATIPLIAEHDVDRPSLLQRIGIALVRAWRGLTGGER